tara:strand:- start:1235 stop:2167 length:933 start_codon:yes stop_codon:yes gene_type:complete
MVTNFLDYFGGPDVDKEDVTNPNTIVVDENGDVYQGGELIKKGEDVKNVKAKDKKEESKVDDKTKSILDSLPPLNSEEDLFTNTTFSKDMKDRLKVAQLLKDDREAAQKEKDRINNLGFFGKMVEKLKTDADARQKFLDQIGSIGAEISRPTDPGEARSLVRDVVVGSRKGEGTSLQRRKAEAEFLANQALAAQRANPMQYYTSTMKELTAMAVGEGLQPGTPAFTTYISTKLRQRGINEQALSLSETLKNLNEQLNQAKATGSDTTMIESQIADVQSALTNTLQGSNFSKGSSSSGDIEFSPNYGYTLK